ncbi:XVIPCD domain-containing protein [Dyella sp.]|uniref:XVIPCD domain-containing protein n=1 Tax=Dyella sp. TaxID=1869338 RepID=UPI002ED43B26
MSREILEEGIRHFSLEGRKYEYGNNASLPNRSPNGRADGSRNERDIDGDGRLGVDCSSLVWRALRNAGYNVGTTPFTTGQLFEGNRATGYAKEHFEVISAADARKPNGSLQPGDIVMFRSSHGQHVGIFKGYDAKGNMQFYGSQTSTGPAMVTTGTAPGQYWNGGDFQIVGALRAKPAFQGREPLHGRPWLRDNARPQDARTPAATPEAERAADARDARATGNRNDDRNTLREGARGDDVRRLQGSLARLGYGRNAGGPLRADGEFGPLTVEALRHFQRDRNITADGVATASTMRALHQAATHEASETRPRVNLNDPSHPDNPMFRQALGAVQALDTRQQRESGPHSEMLAAAMVVAARREGLPEIHHAVLSEDASRVFAVHGDMSSPLKQVAEVPTAHASHLPVEESSSQWEAWKKQMEQQALQTEIHGHFVEMHQQRHEHREAMQHVIQVQQMNNRFG